MTIRVAVVVVCLILGAACAFGLWHVVVGGLVAGNERALTFGLALAAATGVPLLVIVVAARRARGRGTGAGP